MNKYLNKEIETIFLMTDSKYAFLSSTVIREAAYFGGDISDLVPEFVAEKLKNKMAVVRSDNDEKG